MDDSSSSDNDAAELTLRRLEAREDPAPETAERLFEDCDVLAAEVEETPGKATVPTPPSNSSYSCIIVFGRGSWDW
jgi:hypothetical protein